MERGMGKENWKRKGKGVKRIKRKVNGKGEEEGKKERGKEMGKEKGKREIGQGRERK